MRLYTDSEIDLLIDEISGAALEAIEQAAGEAAKAAVLSVIEREAIAMNEAEKWRNEAEKKKYEVEQVKKTGIRNSIITGVICVLSGLVIGITIK